MKDQVEISGPGPVPQDALDFFAAKGLRPAFDYRDVWRQEHSYAFTVAKATEVDLLTSIQEQVIKAISEGQTLRQFKKELTPTLEKMGWWGRQLQGDPLTGETVSVQLGSPRRLKTIYDANMRTAHAAGQWQRYERTKEDLPYLLRTLGPSQEHRPEHAAWHGTLLVIDDPWWSTHMPPDGWGCKCRVRQISRPEHSRLTKNGVQVGQPEAKLNPETGLPTGHLVKEYQPVRTTAPAIHKRQWLNKRTGEVELVAEGCDPGWDTNPGRTRQQNMEKLMNDKLHGADPQLVEAAQKDLANYQRRNAP